MLCKRSEFSSLTDIRRQIIIHIPTPIRRHIHIPQHTFFLHTYTLIPNGPPSPHWPITDQFILHLCGPRCSSVWCRSVLDGLWNAEVCTKPPCSPMRKVFLLAMHFCASHTLQSVLERGQEARVVQLDFTAVCPETILPNRSHCLGGYLSDQTG